MKTSLIAVLVSFWLVSLAAPPVSGLAMASHDRPAAGLHGQDTSPDAAEQESEDIYTCPMHPSVRQKGPGKCPICGMDLTRVRRGPSGADTNTTSRFYVSPAKQQLIGVRYDTVARRTLPKTIRAVGRVDYDERRFAVVNLRYSGWIEALEADYTGMPVKEGDVLFRIYSPEAVSAQREYLLSRSGAADTTWTVDAILGGNDLEQTAREKLHYLGIPGSRIAALDSGSQVERTVPVLAPITGTIINKNATAGMYVEPGTTLYTIADLSGVWMYAEVYQGDLPSVSVGQSSEVTFPQLPGRVFRGTVSFISPVLDPVTRSVRVRIEIPNRDGLLKPEMFGDVSLSSDPGRRLTVPVDAVMQTGKRQVVFVGGDDGEIEARVVRVGRSNATHYEVLSGLHEGERVVSSANFLIDAESRIQGVLHNMDDAAQDGAVKEHHH